MPFRLPSLCSPSAATAALLATLVLSTAAHAEPIPLVSGTVSNEGVVDVNNAAISNPEGPAETRGIIELAFGGLASGDLTALSFSFTPLFTADKTYTITAYQGDGALTSDDFAGNPYAPSMVVYSGNQTDSNTPVTVDLGPAWAGGVFDNILGLRFAETESDGNIVALEYLVLATFVSLTNVTQVTVGQVAQNTTAGFVFGPPTVSVATRAVPEPGTMVLLGAAAAGAWLSRRRRS